MLAGLAALPVFALTTFSGNQIINVTETQRDLADIESATDNLNDLIAIETAIDSEIYWNEGVDALEDYGIPDEFVVSFLEIDLRAELETSQAQVDALLEAYGDPELTAAITEARGETSRGSTELSSLNLASEQALQPRIGHSSQDLLNASSGLPDGQTLAHQAELLARANDLRSAFNELLGAYFFLTVYGSDDPTFALVGAATTLAAYEESAANLKTELEGSDRLGGAQQAVEAAPAVRSIIDRTQAEVTGFDPTELENVEFADPSALLNLAESFKSATSASDAHLQLVEVAAEDLYAELELTRVAEQRRALLLGLVTTAIIVMTLAGLVVVTRSIVGPIRRLGRAAEALATGELQEPLELSGPVEVQAASHTLNQAAENLHRAEAQALALADGRLEDSSFEVAATGTLGRSLDVAVGRLRESMSEREEFRRRLSHEASHDGLTNLPNRSASIANLERALSRAQLTGNRLAVLFIDLDGFKMVNDLHGHGAGDYLLNTVARRLLDTCRPGDRVGRLGGDEFLIVAEPIGSIEAARVLAERIRLGVSASIEYRGQKLTPTVSIGVSLADGSSQADEVIREADYAVYEAKKAGRNQTRAFDDKLRARLRQEADLGTAITEGLQRGEFHLNFQPILSATTNHIHEFEALLRWDRPGVGNVPPDEFIQFAERSDLIIAVDRWVINEGVRHLAEFAKRDDLSSAGLSVNVSGRHLVRGDLFEDVTAALDRWSVDATRLTIEITESALLDDLVVAAETLRRLRKLGVVIAIDDFGTGYTSLAHLRDLPADILKIDRSFTQNLDHPDDLSLIRLITETGHLLGMDITVEGVETEEQQQVLVHLGIDLLQGYLLGRPKPFAEIQTDAELLALS